jgi:uncharacterized membrane protein
MYNPRNQLSSPTTLGIDERWERVLTYALGWITGIIFLLIEQRNATVREHAKQSIIVFGGLSIIGWLAGVFGGLLSNIWVIGFLFGAGFGLIGALVGIVGFVLWIVLMIFAYMSPATFIGSGRTRYM